MERENIIMQLNICKEISQLGMNINTAICRNEGSRFEIFDNLANDLFDVILAEKQIPSKFLKDDVTIAFVDFCDGKRPMDDLLVHIDALDDELGACYIPFMENEGGAHAIH
jgi:hypothetical protein